MCYCTVGYETLVKINSCFITCDFLLCMPTSTKPECFSTMMLYFAERLYDRYKNYPWYLVS